MQNISNKTVSVIVPSFAYGHYLEECILTIINQTHKAHEIIIVSDGAKDNTVEVAKDLIKRFPDANIKLVEKENGGLASARNAGIKIATGQFIQCLDSDDKMVPGCIEEHLKLIVDDKTIAQCALYEFMDRHVIMVPTKPTGLERILRSNTIFCNAMFPRKAWVEVGGYDESEIMRLGREDHLFWIECLAKGYEINSSDFIALRYRVHEGQMTQATLYPNMEKIDKYFREKFADLYEKFNL